MRSSISFVSSSNSYTLLYFTIVNQIKSNGNLLYKMPHYEAQLSCVQAHAAWFLIMPQMVKMNEVAPQDALYINNLVHIKESVIIKKNYIDVPTS